MSSAWRKLWFEVKGHRLTYFQREEDSATLFNRSVSKRGQIKLEEVLHVKRSQAADAEANEIEIVDTQVRSARQVSSLSAPVLCPKTAAQTAEPSSPGAAHLPTALW